MSLASQRLCGSHTSKVAFLPAWTSVQPTSTVFPAHFAGDKLPKMLCYLMDLLLYLTYCSLPSQGEDGPPGNGTIGFTGAPVSPFVLF